MTKLSYRIRGEAEAEIFGVFPEAVVNRCAAAGISLRRVKAVDGQTLRCTLDEKGLARLRAICLRCQCELRLLRLTGGSRDRQLLRRRFWLPLTALLAAGLLLLSSLFVWDIEISGNARVSRGEILRALSESGLRRGCFWPGLQTDLVRSKTLCLLPELAWMGVNVNGSRAVVLVEERAEKPEIYHESAPCELVASHTGVVRRVSVLNGKALVAPGSAVQEGEVLVSGAPENLMGEPRFVRARAEIWADTWYELTAVCPPSGAGKGAAKRKSTRFALKIGDERINFYGKSRKTLDGYDKIVHEYNLGIKGLFSTPLTLLRTERYSLLPPGAERDRTEEMKARLLRRLEESIDGEVLEYSFSAGRSGGLLVVTLRARCSENIAQTVEYEP